MSVGAGKGGQKSGMGCRSWEAQEGARDVKVGAGALMWKPPHTVTATSAAGAMTAPSLGMTLSPIGLGHTHTHPLPDSVLATTYRFCF